MPKKKPSRYIPVLVGHPISEFLKNARTAYRQSFPDEIKKPGRHSEREAVIQAMKSLLLSAEVTSVRKWSQELWANRIHKITNISHRTIHKHFKEILSRGLLPVHMIPASFVKTLPLEQQSSHWLAVAVGEAVERLSEPGSTTVSIPYQEIFERHQKLMARHKARVPA